MKKRTLSPQKVALTDEVLRALSFEKRVIGINPDDGSLNTVALLDGMTDWFLRDASMPGFSVRVTGKGKKFYAERKLAGRPCRFDCGSWPETSLAKARKTADAALAKMRLGQDPNLEKKKAVNEVIDARAKAQLTFGFIVARDAQNRAEEDAPSTARDRKDVQKWLDPLKIWRMPIGDVTAQALQEMMEVLRKNKGNPTAVKVWRYARAAWTRLPASESPPVDPFAEWKKARTLPVIKKRQTSISTDDAKGRDWLKAVAALRKVEGSRAFARRVMADYILLSLCWGARRSEAARLEVSNVDFEREFVVFRDTKNKSDHFFPLTPGCAAILRSRIEDNNAPRGRDVKKAAMGEEYYIPQWVFPSQKRGVHLVEPSGALGIGQEKSGMKVTMHDLRRGFAGEIATDVFGGAEGVRRGDFSLVKLAMNHADMANDVTQGYIMLKAKLNMLRPLYLAHEKRVLNAAGILAKNEPEMAVKIDEKMEIEKCDYLEFLAWKAQKSA